MARTRVTKRTLRRQAWGRTPLAKELVTIANALQSAKLLALAEKVRGVETRANALDTMLKATGKMIARNSEDGKRDQHAE